MKKSFLQSITHFALDRPKTVIGLVLFLTLLFALQFPGITIDTDPENMLEADQPERVFYDQTKEEFGIHDLLVVGIEDANGIFRVEPLERIVQATKEILKIKGVIIQDVVSPSTTNNVKSNGGFLDIHPVITEVPRTAEGMERLRKDIASNPFLHEKIASKDGTAIALYIPIQSKDESYRIAAEITRILKDKLLPEQTFHLAGLPIAEDTFGHEMFVEMAVVAPLAFLLIMLLMYLLFRRAVFLIPVGMDALFAVIWAMGLLIGTGNTVHIMSSMIPIFLMPIAILDDIHILSECYDGYCVHGDKRKAILDGMAPLYRPMLFTSLTSAVGFGSLALTDIPPVRVFGLFVAFGIMMAWVFSMTVVPACLSLMSDKQLRQGINFGGAEKPSLLDRYLKANGAIVFSRAKTIVVLSIVILMLGGWGIAKININDNPIKWFKKSHPLRIADVRMNQLFGGTYMAYLVLDGQEPEAIKRPEVIKYIDRVQARLEADPLVGKTSSVANIVKRINYVLHDNDSAYDLVPDSADAVGQFLFLFQSAGDPNDLESFVNNDASKANIWVQMKGGDNRQMKKVEDSLAAFLENNPPPRGISIKWSGLTYINQIWQDLMVKGMLKAILGSFLVVFLLMLMEFRSLTLGLLSMIPLTVAMVLSYGLVGWLGKDYDMPIAICSALSLGMAVDFAIHFLQRYKEHYLESRDGEETHNYMFGEPGRAIAKNAIVISLGFLPLLISTLTPYLTVGVFFALLMIFSTVATMFLLPAALILIGPEIFVKKGA